MWKGRAQEPWSRAIARASHVGVHAHSPSAPTASPEAAAVVEGALGVTGIICADAQRLTLLMARSGLPWGTCNGSQPPHPHTPPALATSPPFSSSSPSPWGSPMVQPAAFTPHSGGHQAPAGSRLQRHEATVSLRHTPLAHMVVLHTRCGLGTQGEMVQQGPGTYPLLGQSCQVHQPSPHVAGTAPRACGSLIGIERRAVRD